MGFNLDTQATRSTLMSVDSTLSANITATQDYIPIASTTNFSTSVVAEIETTNEIVSFATITKNFQLQSQTLDNAGWTKRGNATVTADATTAPDGTTTADLVENIQRNGVYSDIYYSISTDYSTTGQDLELSFYIKKVSSSGTLAAGNPENGAQGKWLIDFSVLGSDWERITKSHAAVTVENTYTSSSSGNAGTHFFIESGSTGDLDFYCWGAQVEAGTSVTGYIPTTTTAVSGLTTVTRGVNGTTAALATSGDAIQQLPYALSEVDMPTRLRGISVSSDGTGAGRFTLCDKVGTTLCDLDIPRYRIYDLSFGGGIIFPNGIFVSNSDNITGYTLYTDKHSGAAL